jgi:Tfp pilus assembly protein PilN
LFVDCLYALLCFSLPFSIFVLYLGWESASQETKNRFLSKTNNEIETEIETIK